MIKNTFYLTLLCLFITTLNSYSQIPAFPGAEGYGKYSVGGRGGEVIRVINLNDSGPGSLREAIDANYPRTVIFDVGGRINLLSTLTIANPFITIAGQHSVGDGITLSMEGTPNEVVLKVNTHDVIIRYLTLRRSEFEVSEQNSDNLAISDSYNIIVDHCSFSWASDENIAIYDYDGNNEPNVYDITIQNCLIDTAWGGTDKGIIASGGVDRLTFYNLLFTSVGQRQPLIKNEIGNYATAETYFEIINTVTFEGKLHASFPNNIEEAGIKHLNYINNLCIDSGFSRNMLYVNTAFPVSIYTSGNISPLRTSIISPVDWDEEWSVIQPGGGSSDVENTLDTSFRVIEPKNTPIINDGVVLIDAVDLFDNLKDHVGASLPTRDSEDNRAINDVETLNSTAPVLSGTFPIINNGTPLTDLDNDGMPDFWETFQFNGLASDGVIDTDGDGYTDLEEYLNQTANGQMPDIPAEDVNITPEMATVNVPETILLSKTFIPSNTTNQSGVWTSSDNSIATVASNGLVSAVSEGTAIIAFTTNDGGFIDSTEITVTNITVPLESVSLNPTEITLDVNEVEQLIKTLIPANTTDILGTWTSNDDTIVSVDTDGRITGISEGTTEIIYTNTATSLTATTVVTVIDTFYGSYQLYNANTDVIIQPIVGDTDINIANEGNEINFRCIPEDGDDNDSVESVRIDWTGQASGTYSESQPLYAGLPGGHDGLNFYAYLVEEGTYDFTITYYDENGASGEVIAVDTFSLTFFFSSVPVANAGVDQDICEGETVSLTASGGPNFLWNNGETTATIEVSPLVSTTYSVSVFDNEGNIDQDSVTVNVNSFPTADAGEDKTICEGESVTLIASGGTSYLWSTGETTSSIEVSPNFETVFSVEVTSNSCSSTDDVTVFVNPITVITVTEDLVIIEGDSTTLTASGVDNYEWNNGETTESITVTPESTTTYSVTSLNSNGCVSYAEVLVTVIPELNASVSEDVTICSGESVTLSGSGGITYAWNTGKTGSTLTVSPTETTIYTVTVSDGFGNTDSASVTVTVNETPNVTVSENITISEGDSINLVANGADSYLWNTGGDTESITVSPTNTTTYTVLGFSINGCQSNNQVVVTVIPELIANAGADVSICNGQSITLNASGGLTYTWNTGATGAIYTVSPTETSVYTVNVSDGFGNTDSDTVTVTVNESPNVSVSENITISEGESTVLIANGADSYLWNTGETSQSITVNPSNTVTYTVIGYSINGCQDLNQVIVTVIPELIANAGADVSICSGESVTLNASGGITYTWNTGATGAIYTVSPTETTTYTVTASNGTGNTDSDSVTVTVNNTPTITVSENITISEGESTNLIATGANAYVWTTGQSSSMITVSPTQTTTYSVIGISNTCSSEEVQVTVFVEGVFEAFAGEDKSVCDNLDYEVVLQANDGDSYFWSTGETTQDIVVSPQSTTIYSVTVTSGSQSDTDEVTVYVEPSPEVEIANGDNVEILNGDFITLSASGANSYLWNNGASQPNIAVSPSVTTTYEVRGSIGDCYDDKQIIVNVLEPVIASAGEDVLICLNEMAILTATGGDEYLWSTGETTQTIEVSPSVTTDYTVTVFNALDFDEATVRVDVDAGCSDSGPIEPGEETQGFTLDVYPNPATHTVNIKLSGSLLISDIYIHDLSGKLILRREILNETSNESTITKIDVTALQEGVYFVKLFNEGEPVTRKLIIY